MDRIGKYSKDFLGSDVPEKDIVSLKNRIDSSNLVQT